MENILKFKLKRTTIKIIIYTCCLVLLIAISTLWVNYKFLFNNLNLLKNAKKIIAFFSKGIDKELISTSIGALVGAWAASAFALKTQRKIDTQKNNENGRKSASILHRDMDVITREYMRLNNIIIDIPDADLSKYALKIDYDKNWRNYYYQLSGYAKYDYYENISLQYNIALTINNLIESKDWNQLKNYARTIYSQNQRQAFTSGFNYFDTVVNLLYLSVGEKELPKFFDRKEIIGKLDDLYVKYAKIIENKVYNILIRCEEIKLSDIEDDIINWLKNNSKEFMFTEWRIIQKLILDVCLKSDKISITWNYLRIKV